MSKYRNELPQLKSKSFITDGGLETTLIFLESIDLPEFASFPLLANKPGCEMLKRYFQTYAQIGASNSVGIVLETATWRANADWSNKLGFSSTAIAELNRKSVQLIEDIRERYDTPDSPIVISGCVGPRHDGYNPEVIMSTEEAMTYHKPQIAVFSQTQADLVTGLTMTNVEEATGIVLAAQALEMPVCISFTVEIDGRLPTGDSLAQAISKVDSATNGGPVYYMVNCAHPSHFDSVIDPDTAWARRIRGIRANASRMCHAELDEATELDDGNPKEFANDHQVFKALLPNLNILGGCCGTDHRHIESVCRVLP